MGREIPRPNRLISEKSPYLLQHAHNPVDWYPWGEEAFHAAQKSDCPIFLSIGYSTCHWCHVMEKESFEDANVAELLNNSFICIKVDREERPDIDNIYMAACMLMTGSGGWPLTVIMTPDKRPFFAGTYFPKESHFGRPGMLQLLPLIEKMWKTDREKILDAADQLVNALRENETRDITSRHFPMGLLCQSAFDNLREIFDKKHGGFGTAPKFPAPHQLTFLMSFSKRYKNDEALSMALQTLDAMRDGGIYDQIGFGFHRYSTDSAWLVPHFEKMLYDQAMLCLAYTEAYELTGKGAYRKTAEEILEYVMNDLTSPDGVFYSGEDADSEGEEGKFYLWTRNDIYKILASNDADLICEMFGIEEQGNFVDHLTGEKPGTNILYRKRSIEELAVSHVTHATDIEARIGKARIKLLKARAGRIRPHKDDKVLADCNGLMISALARAAKAFGNSSYADAAVKAADFILSCMRLGNGRLLHRHRENQAAIPGFLDDHAFMESGLIDLYIATSDRRFLNDALSINSVMLKHFRDNSGRGFFFTSEDAEPIIFRSRIINDSALPSGNSVALHCMLKLSAITDDFSLGQEANSIIKTLSSEIAQSPTAHTYLLHALLQDPENTI